MRSNSAITSISMPASRAIAVRCMNAFVEPDAAVQNVMAFSIDSRVIMSREPLPCFTISVIATPVAVASISLFGSAAGVIAPFGRHMPIASAIPHMVFAVPKKVHEPQDPQILSSSAENSSSVIFPFLYEAAASVVCVLSSGFPFSSAVPRSIGPAGKNMHGMSSLAAAMSIPGTILSHDPRRTRPASLCASAIISIESAMTSREGRMYFIPSCPCAIPSQAAGTPKVTAVQPPR